MASLYILTLWVTYRFSNVKSFGHYARSTIIESRLSITEHRYNECTNNMFLIFLNQFKKTAINFS